MAMQAARVHGGDDGSDGFRLDAFLPYRLNQLAERVSGGLAAVYAERFNLTVAQWRILATLQAEPGLAARDVARRGNLDKVRTSRALADLVARGLVQRRVSTRDGRAVELRLSGAGRQLFRRIAPLALAWERDLLQYLDAREGRLLGVLLDKLDRGLAACVAAPGDSAATPEARETGAP